MPSPPEDVVAFTSAHSRSYTALAAMHRLGLRPRCRGVLRLLCLGADRREGTSPEATAAVFGALRGGARRSGAFPGYERTQGWTYDAVMRGVERVDIALVGPNVTLDARFETDVFHDARGDDDGDGLLPARVAYGKGLYHELESRPEGFPRRDFFDRNDRNPTETWVPDLALAYNAGVWGYAPEEWAPTFFALANKAAGPAACCVTGYSVPELENDEECLEAMRETKNGETSEAQLTFAWACEPNPFASLEPRALRFPRAAYDGGAVAPGAADGLRENDAWLCVAAASV